MTLEDLKLILEQVEDTFASDDPESRSGECRHCEGHASYDRAQQRWSQTKHKPDCRYVKARTILNAAISDAEAHARIYSSGETPR